MIVIALVVLLYQQARFGTRDYVVFEHNPSRGLYFKNDDENRDALERGRLTVPVLGISSSHGSIPDMAASLGPWAENTTGVVIQGAGHFIPDEQPGAVVQALTAFLDQERAG